MRLWKSRCERKGHKFSGSLQVMESVPLGTGGLAHTTLMFASCAWCRRAHSEFGTNSLGMTVKEREELEEMFRDRGHEVFLAKIEFWEEDL